MHSRNAVCYNVKVVYAPACGVRKRFSHLLRHDLERCRPTGYERYAASHPLSISILRSGSAHCFDLATVCGVLVLTFTRLYSIYLDAGYSRTYCDLL